MRRVIVTVLSVSLFGAAGLAAAKNSQKFESTMNSPVIGPVHIEVGLGNDLAYRAENLPKDIGMRSSRRLNAGFSNNGFYGERDLVRLTERLESRLQQRLAKSGLPIDGQSGTTLRVTITDASPSRPTFRQLSKDSSLSYESVGLGGASFVAQIVAADGRSLGEIRYAWYENDIRDSRHGGTWSDADRAIDRFARKVAKNLT